MSQLPACYFQTPIGRDLRRHEWRRQQRRKGYVGSSFLAFPTFSANTYTFNDLAVDTGAATRSVAP